MNWQRRFLWLEIKSLNTVLFALFLVLPCFLLHAQQPLSLSVYCSRSGNADMIETLLEGGADWTELTIKPKDPSLFQNGELIISTDIHRSYATLLMDWGMPVNIRDERGRTFLMKAADYDDQNMVLALLDPDGNPGLQPRRRAPEELAIAPEGPARTKSNRNAADPNITDIEGRTALLYTPRREIVSLLLRYGADPGIADKNGETAMHRWHSTVGAKPLLVEAGADVDAANNKGLTPLMKEAARGVSNDPNKHIEFIKELLELGADPHKKTNDGKNLLLIYLENHSLQRFTRDLAQPAVVQFLLDLGIDPAETDDSGNSALYYVLKGDKKSPEVTEIQNLCLTAANKREIAAAKKHVRQEKRHEFALTVPDKLFYSSFLLFPLGYLGFSIGAREGIYRDNPEANWMGTVNTFMTVFIAGTIITLMPFVIWGVSESGFDRFLPVLFAIFIPPLIGIITGGTMGNNSHISSSFKKNPWLYYITPALAGAISIPILIYIWRN